MSKVCPTCKLKKEDVEFNKETRNKNGISTYCKTCLSINKKKYRERNKEKVSELKKQSRLRNIDKIKKNDSLYYQNNKEKIKERVRKYRKENKDKRNENDKMRKKIDLLFKIKANIRTRLHKILGRGKLSKDTKTIIGCTYEELVIHLEKQFKKGMNWDNHGFYGWHIDHKIPLSSAKTEEELIKLCHYTNLQPLWAEENMAKGNKILN